MSASEPDGGHEALWGEPRGGQRTLSQRDRRLPDRDHHDADRECVHLPQLRPLGLLHAFFNNHVVLAGLVFEIDLVVLFDYSAWANLRLHTAPVLAALWLLLLPLAIGMLLTEEARKWLVRRVLRASSRERPQIMARHEITRCGQSSTAS